MLPWVLNTPVWTHVQLQCYKLVTHNTATRMEGADASASSMHQVSFTRLHVCISKDKCSKYICPATLDFQDLSPLSVSDNGAPAVPPPLQRQRGGGGRGGGGWTDPSLPPPPPPPPAVLTQLRRFCDW